MTDYLDALAWPQPSRLRDYDDLPVGRDLIMVGAAELERLHRDWSRFMSAVSWGRQGTHDDGIDARWCAIEKRRPESLDVNVCITQITRYHGVVKILPRSKVVLCVDFYDHEERPYVVVDQAWFDEITKERHCLYALVDAIGMRELLRGQGRITAGQLARLRDGIDSLARDHIDHVFLTFADSVLLKSNWVSTDAEYEASYRPEAFIDLTGEICEVLKEALGLNAYAIVTQGVSAAEEDCLLHVADTGNHIFFSSLAAPFAELSEIDKAVRLALREKKHSPRELYLACSVFWSLQLSRGNEREHPLDPLADYKSVLTPADLSRYQPVDRAHLHALLRR